MVSNRRLLILVAVATFLVALTTTRFLQGRDGGSAAPMATLTTTPTTAAIPSLVASLPVTTAGAAGVVVVDVAGAVRNPGVVRLAADSRVADAIRAAGGATRRADLASVNLAAHVADGVQIVVGVRGAAGTTAAPTSTIVPASSGRATTAAGPVSLSSADSGALDGLPGIGPATAQKIIDYRNEHGPFLSVDDLVDVPGIGPAKLEALRSAVVP